MNSWYECKIKYRKTDENGRDKLVSEPYLIDALSFTEAEKRTHEELSQYISTDFRITNIKTANFSEIIPVEDSDRWFKCKLSLISFDEEKGQERRANSYILVQANNAKEAYDNLYEYMNGTTSDFEIPAIAESPIMDVFPYEGGELEEREEVSFESSTAAASEEEFMEEEATLEEETETFEEI
ncbi:MAG: DUF4494 domain-containing protein [Flavobacteriaceae bacterium]